MELAFINQSPQLTQDGAFELVSRFRAAAANIEKVVTIAILDSSGQIIILTRGDGGGQPLWQNGKIVGSIGVAGGGSPDNDDNLAKSAIISKIGISTQK